MWNGLTLTTPSVFSGPGHSPPSVLITILSPTAIFPFPGRAGESHFQSSFNRAGSRRSQAAMGTPPGPFRGRVQAASRFPGRKLAAVHWGNIPGLRGRILTPFKGAVNYPPPKPAGLTAGMGPLRREIQGLAETWKGWRAWPARPRCRLSGLTGRILV